MTSFPFLRAEASRMSLIRFDKWWLEFLMVVMYCVPLSPKFQGPGVSIVSERPAKIWEVPLDIGFCHTQIPTRMLKVKTQSLRS